MCGIAGRIDWRGLDQRARVTAMCAKIARRGPDAECVEWHGPATLGHRRLSIIDLSEQANQPMRDASGRYTIVFNGEIYNYRDVAAELAGTGVAFRTRGDTEIVLEAYKAWGPAALGKLTGMFAIAIWDASDQTLFLARDRFGEKPLYLAEHKDGLVFASQLDAVLAGYDGPVRLDEEAVAHFFAFGYTGGTRSAIAGVEKLPPASWCVYGRDGLGKPQRYWDLLGAYEKRGGPRSLDAAGEALAALLDRAAEGQLIADVPVGAFLSGGVDSSSIVASLCRAREPGDVKTFSIGFDVAGFSELAQARHVAAALGVDHRDETVAADTVGVRDWAAAWDEPFADTSMVPTWVLGRFARRHVKVALSGDAGDELFAGYETYTADKLRASLARLPSWLLAGAGAAAGRLLPHRRGKVGWDFKVRRFLRYASLDAADAHASWRRVFEDGELATMLRPAAAHWAQIDPLDESRKIARDARDLHWVDRMGYLDIRTWLVDDILVKVDRGTMAHGLEARVPFLDHRLAEFAAGLPPEMKLDGFAKKRVLKHSQRDRLPPETLARRKEGFGAPVAHWQAEWDKDGDLLSPEKLAGGYFEPAAIRALLDDHRDGRRDNGHKIFALLNFRLWRERVGV